MPKNTRTSQLKRDARKSRFLGSRSRARFDATGGKKYFRIVVVPKSEFMMFRSHIVGKPGHIERLSGKRKSGLWATHAWLVSREDAHTENGQLIPDTEEAKRVFCKWEIAPRRIRGDIYSVRERKDGAGKFEPTEAQRRARRENMKKAQKARWARA